jgi:ElaB/YqjD/DUF883 family membrane-anchored ribosome-binding protein
MTDEQYVKQTAHTRILQHTAGAVVCFCVDAYLSSTPWASVALWAIGASCFVTIGYLTGVLRMAEKLSNNK